MPAFRGGFRKLLPAADEAGRLQMRLSPKKKPPELPEGQQKKGGLLTLFLLSQVEGFSQFVKFFPGFLGIFHVP